MCSLFAVASAHHLVFLSLYLVLYARLTQSSNFSKPTLPQKRSIEDCLPDGWQHVSIFNSTIAPISEHDTKIYAGPMRYWSYSPVTLRSYKTIIFISNSTLRAVAQHYYNSACPRANPLPPQPTASTIPSTEDVPPLSSTTLDRLAALWINQSAWRLFCFSFHRNRQPLFSDFMHPKTDVMIDGDVLAFEQYHRRHQW